MQADPWLALVLAEALGVLCLLLLWGLTLAILSVVLLWQLWRMAQMDVPTAQMVLQEELWMQTRGDQDRIALRLTDTRRLANRVLKVATAADVEKVLADAMATLK